MERKKADKRQETPAKSHKKETRKRRTYKWMQKEKERKGKQNSLESYIHVKYLLCKQRLGNISSCTIKKERKVQKNDLVD